MTVPLPSSSSVSSARSTITTSSVPVLIAGAGPVGLFEAFSLAKLGIQRFSLQLWYDLGQAKTSEILIEELEKVGVKVDYGWELLDTKVVEEYEEDKTSGSGKKTKKNYVKTKIRRALSSDNTVQDEKKYLGGINLLEEQGDKEYEIQVVRSEYLVATDGGRSTVRHKLNIGFPGRTSDFKTMGHMKATSSLLTRVSRNLTDTDPINQCRNIYGVNRKGVVAFPLPNGNYRIVVEAGKLDPNEDLSKTMESLTVEKFEKLVSECIAPATFKVKTTSWLTIYKVNERRAEHFVYKSRIFLAGDSAHVHSPAGGQGLNTGLQDAHNLAWKLAFVMNGVAPESLLETYEEREDMADRAIALSSKLLYRDRTSGLFSHVMKLVTLKAFPLLLYLAKVFSSRPDVGMMNVRYHESVLNKRHETQPAPSPDYQVGIRARDGRLHHILPLNDLESQTTQIRLHELMKGIGRFHILVFTSDMLAQRENAPEIDGVYTTRAKELDQNNDNYLTQWRSRWSYASDMQDGYQNDKDLFKVHVISGSVTFEGDDKAYLDALIERDPGNGKAYLDDTKTVHQKYGYAWNGGAGGIVVVRPDSHVGYQVNGAGSQAWKDVEEYFTSNLTV
ncbi:hypothetical protein BGZ80_002703 [Entomortierella chlamydospora]|uniref:FAD-binding domain-containing protein n=1 Tax=Entomortierella chlamydospora TaxID=101097 RepID=A0A9P6N158_9FUNG|nr:hypothetical protein BGZ79_005842 [Entomortierella chlamydospora]KAG0021282.1 hypothetical protein BGZ80_002703 [Entomortierella chlamydospora]